MDAQAAPSWRKSVRALGAAASLAFFVVGSAAYFVRYASVLYFQNRPTLEVVGEALRRLRDLT